MSSKLKGVSIHFLATAKMPLRPDGVNVFTWLGPDLRPTDRQSHTVAYGLLAGKTFRRLWDTIIANIRARQARSVERDE